MEVVHRAEVTRLVELLRAPSERLTLIGVSGPGGVGKSFLLNDALEALGPDLAGYLQLRVDGSQRHALGDLFALIEQLFPRSLPPPADPEADYFPQVRKVATAHRAMLDDFTTERADQDDRLTEAAVSVLRLGHALNKAVPKTREYLDVKSLGVGEDDVRKLLGAAKALQESTQLPGPVRDLLGVTFRNRVRTDLYGVTAEAMLTDLSAALVGYRTRDLLRITHRPLRDRNTDLLLVVDDFEALAPTLEPFLLGALLPRLKSAPFQTVVIVIGRDDLGAMSPSWEQHFHRHIAARLRLDPFDRETALALLAQAGIAPERRDDLFAATQGFPYLLSLVLEEAGQGEADAALFLKKFFDRTTRWMTPTEQGWFVRVCYLDAVDEDTLGRLFSAEEAGRVQRWFEGEASIRDPASAVFRVRPLIREKVLRYQSLRAPGRHRALLAQAQGEPGAATP